MRALPMLLLLPVLPLRAAEDRQVAWVGDWEKAFAESRESGRPVMVCINSKDGEIANERAAKDTYHDPEFVELSRRFVMVIVSTVGHAEDGVACPRFGGVTCEQHLACWKELKARHGTVFSPGGTGEMISPQHAWFQADGTLLRRKEYELTKAELLQRMRAVLDGGAKEPSAGPEPAPGGEGPPPSGDPKDAPLTDMERAQLERVKTGDAETIQAALAGLLESGKSVVHAELALLLQNKGNADRKCAILAALGKAVALPTRTAVEERLQDPDEKVRSFAAVALERLGQKESVEPLLERVKKERDTNARKNMARALGFCGGRVAHEQAAKQLVKMLRSDKQNLVRKYSAIAMRYFEGEAAKLVLPALEKEALEVKDRNVRSGVVYALAHIGNTATTIPVLEKLLEKQHDEYAAAYLRGAIAMVRTGSGDMGEALRWVFWEDREDPARKE